MEGEYFNPGFTEVVEDGAPGSQAYQALFYQNARGRFQRMYNAEGHEIAKNPETQERNRIGQKSPVTTVRAYKEHLTKNFIIEKGDENYEFFQVWNEEEFTGKNAVLKVMLVNMMKDDRLGVNMAGRRKYWVKTYDATVAVTTANHTDGTLSVDFNQASDPVKGLAEIIDDTAFPVFTPQSEIPLTEISLSDDDIEIEIKEASLIEVTISPIGANTGFTVKSSDTDICTAERLRNSVRIYGVEDGIATVTVKSLDETKTKTISVKVGAGEP